MHAAFSEAAQELKNPGSLSHALCLLQKGLIIIAKDACKRHISTNQAGPLAKRLCLAPWTRLQLRPLETTGYWSQAPCPRPSQAPIALETSLCSGQIRNLTSIVHTQWSAPCLGKTCMPWNPTIQAMGAGLQPAGQEGHSPVSVAGQCWMVKIWPRSSSSSGRLFCKRFNLRKLSVRWCFMERTC